MRWVLGMLLHRLSEREIKFCSNVASFNGIFTTEKAGSLPKPTSVLRMLTIGDEAGRSFSADAGDRCTRAGASAVTCPGAQPPPDAAAEPAPPAQAAPDGGGGLTMDQIWPFL